MSDLKHCYEILEIKPGSTYKEAKLAFRDMVSIWHPDKFSNNSRLKEKAEEKLKDLNAAWEELQAFFFQKEDAAAEQPCRELAGPVKTHMPQERKHRQREGKAVRTDCCYADLECEPLVHIEQARKAYRHRFHSLHPDLEAPQGVDSASDGIAAEDMYPQKSAGEWEQRETARQRGIRLLRHDQGERDVTRRHPDEQEFSEKKSGTVKQLDKADKEPARGKKAAQHSPEDSFKERDYFPVLLNWDRVQECISRLNDITGLKFRVPTEAEWEYAARSGGKDDNWSAISDGSAIHDHASPAGCIVGQSKPNGLGFFDMLGNSSEWVTGCSPEQPRQIGPQGATRRTGNSGRMVIRGAVHRDLPENFTVSYTFHRSFPSTDKALRFSFRLAHATL